MGGLFTKLLDAFYAKKLEVVLVGLENSGKTTLLNVLAAGRPVETCPTIGLNVKLVRKGGVQMKCWDIGGQAQRVRRRRRPRARARDASVGRRARATRRYRSEWGRYTRGCDVIIYVVDANALDSIPLARKELHRLLEDRELATTPVLVIANKIDLDPHISEPDLIRELNLDYVTENPWIVIPVSALKVINIDQVLSWLIKQGSNPK